MDILTHLPHGDTVNQPTEVQMDEQLNGFQNELPGRHWQYMWNQDKSHRS